MEKTHRLRWAEMRPSERRDAAVSFIGQVLKWAFVGAMCIFTLYPVIYTLLGSFKTNAELTLGGALFAVVVLWVYLCFPYDCICFWHI